MVSQPIAAAKAAFEFPAMPYEDWKDSKETLHLFCQIVGKVRLKLHPKLNHWWHVTLYPSSRGFSTGKIPYGGNDLQIDFDLIDHCLILRTCGGGLRSFDLPGLSVSAFYGLVMSALEELQVPVRILARPYDHPSKIPFAEDHAPRAYDKAAIHRYWRVTSQIGSIFEVFRAGFVGKATPVHLFWHSFDLAYTRFSGRPAPRLQGRNPSDEEAYSHEVISVGFWAGDDTVREPAFYAYAYPDPEGLADTPIEPGPAVWNTAGGTAMGFLRYEDFRVLDDPQAGLLAFCESAYANAARLANWPDGLLTTD
ncbi:MAG: DUF5996 family protein [Pseudomonadota bacterium]